MDRKKMKVFHGLVNYGTQSGFHARELRGNGIDAKSITQYDPFERVTDVTLNHSGTNIVQKLYNYIWNKLFLCYCFFRYNIFHFYAGKSLTNSQWELPFYRFFGKKVVFEYLGIDVQKYKYSVENFKFTNIIYLVDEDDAEEHDRKIESKLIRHNKYADLQLVCAPCYSPYVSGSKVLPLGINLEEFPFTTMPDRKEKIKIMHAPTHRCNKGTEFIIDAIDRLIENDYNVGKMLVENVSHSRLKELYRECDIFVDHIMGGWYGTASIEAMALGRPVVCCLYPEFFEYVDYGDKIPMRHADPDCIYDTLEQLVRNREVLPQLGKQGREFVEEVHDVKKNTNWLLEQYQQL